jgi:hypothetical protein
MLPLKRCKVLNIIKIIKINSHLFTIVAVDGLVNEEHEGEFENISFERATETSVPKEWLFQLVSNKIDS